MFDTINNAIHAHYQALTQNEASISTQIAEASVMLSDCFLNEKKVLVCSSGSSNFLATHFATTLNNRYENERPSLPVSSLGSDSASILSVLQDAGISEIYAKPVQALGQKDDILFIIADRSHDQSLIQAIQAAHDREMHIIALTTEPENSISSLLLASDIEILVQVDSSRARRQEIQLICINCICELIDKQIFGA